MRSDSNSFIPQCDRSDSYIVVANYVLCSVPFSPICIKKRLEKLKLHMLNIASNGARQNIGDE
jgi:hypothetical protein